MIEFLSDENFKSVYSLKKDIAIKNLADSMIKCRSKKLLILGRTLVYALIFGSVPARQLCNCECFSLPFPETYSSFLWDLGKVLNLLELAL